MLNVGDSLPKFESKNQDGNPVSSNDFKGKKLVVFFIQKQIHLVVQQKLATSIII